jgi:hypothetical protein
LRARAQLLRSPDFFRTGIELKERDCYAFVNLKGLAMFASIQLSQWTSCSFIYQTFFFNSLSLDSIKRIKEIAITIFSKISAFCKSFNNQSKEINVKAIAMISCLSLVALLVISILRRRDSVLIPMPSN